MQPDSPHTSTDFGFTVAVRLRTGVPASAVKERLDELKKILERRKIVPNWKAFRLDECGDAPVDGLVPLSELIQTVTAGDISVEDEDDVSTTELQESQFRIYTPSQEDSLSQEVSVDSSGDSSVGSQHWTLPSVHFEGIWENLHFDSNMKNELLAFVFSLIRLSQKGVDVRVVNVNRMILLLGPPGTGKTSLCKAISQQLAIRLKPLYPRAALVEINAHSLFSKWFSESGKLVLKMFEQIDELAEDSKCMVMVLIDEVESLGMNRDSASNRGDPSDSIRAVNALLTQIDRIRRRDNVMILCTSNLSNCLDIALLDRADLVRTVPLPGRKAVQWLLSSGLQEMQRIGACMPADDVDKVAEKLGEISLRGEGMSARALRKVPAVAYSKAMTDVLTTEQWLEYVATVVDEMQREKRTNSN